MAVKLWDNAGKRRLSSNISFKVSETHSSCLREALPIHFLLKALHYGTCLDQALRKELEKGFRDTSKTVVASAREKGTVFSLKLIPETEVSLSALVRCCVHGAGLVPSSRLGRVAVCNMRSRRNLVLATD